MVKRIFVCLTAVFILMSIISTQAFACTGIRIIAKDGGVVYGRTMEWGAFDLNSNVAVVPRDYSFTGQTPDGFNGKKWKVKYGFASIDMMGQNIFADGMNEKGLAAGLFYHPGFAVYPDYDKTKAGSTITASDMVAYILSNYSTTDEVKAGLKNVRTVAVVEKAIGIPIQAHWMVTDASGKSIVIEYKDKQMAIYDNPLGVITNAPDYDWHMTNMRNYVNLSPVAIPTKKIDDLNFAPLGGGSGMIGLPGDFTPPSRFVRAVAWTQTHRPLKDSGEAVYELFRILDNFNVPLGASEGSNDEGKKLEHMRSSTIWTSGWDTSKKILYYHTQNNRRVRKVDMNKVDYSGSEIVRFPLDEKKEQDVQDVTPIRAK
ncbi:MAG: choloylglycine hydrolase family protein [Firmicutes bacterium]|nr:choloylglycine hydrolase family protein [Bacillota bacterium]